MESTIKWVDNKKLSSLLIKLVKENNDKETIMKYIITNFSFEKYNTKNNYFFVRGWFSRL